MENYHISRRWGYTQYRHRYQHLYLHLSNSEYPRLPIRGINHTQVGNNSEHYWILRYSHKSLDGASFYFLEDGQCLNIFIDSSNNYSYYTVNGSGILRSDKSYMSMMIYIFTNSTSSSDVYILTIVDDNAGGCIRFEPTSIINNTFRESTNLSYTCVNKSSWDNNYSYTTKIKYPEGVQINICPLGDNNKLYLNSTYVYTS